MRFGDETIVELVSVSFSGVRGMIPVTLWCGIDHTIHKMFPDALPLDFPRAGGRVSACQCLAKRSLRSLTVLQPSRTSALLSMGRLGCTPTVVSTLLNSVLTIRRASSLRSLKTVVSTSCCASPSGGRRCPPSLLRRVARYVHAHRQFHPRTNCIAVDAHCAGQP